MNTKQLYDEAITLLQQLIGIPSFSKEEEKTARLIEQSFLQKNIQPNRLYHNIWCSNKYFDPAKPTILLNSHHDTVKPNAQYTKDPFQPLLKNGQLFGLGSNDAGGCLVSLMAAFLHFYEKENLRYNLILAATAEEEISGANGIESILPHLPPIDFAIVGEPTQTNLAIAEKGLLVLDCTAWGKAAHAAREEGENAIYKALKDIEWFGNFRFPKISRTLGPVTMQVTSIYTENKAHNIVPATCAYVVDIRVTDAYMHEEIIEIIQQHIHSNVQARSTRLRSSKIEADHPVVLAGIKLGKKVYGSATTSDAALIPVPVLKCGPGDSARSHTADEFIYLHEIEEGINTYINILQQIV